VSRSLTMFPTSIDAVEWTNPDHVASVLCAAFALWCLVASWVTGTHSHVDRLWSITPIVYAAVYAHMSDYDARCVLMAALVAVWGSRLTYNFARKGGYSAGEQDYRWPVLQKMGILQNQVIWQIFNVGFIAFYQHFLLLLIAAGPMSSAYYSRKGQALDVYDLIATASFLGFLTLESIADQQQWRFQQAKHEVKGFPRDRSLREDYRRGFLTRGLFKYSRHPNFFSEQCIWVSFALFAVIPHVVKGPFLGTLPAIKTVLGTPRLGLGVFLLILLFQGSTAFTESITLKKYPSYAEYQKSTSRLVPLPPGGVMPPKSKPKKSRR